VVASGGVAAISDIHALKRAAETVGNLEGVIVGRALYDGRLNAADALAAC
jgi:phosphoribosylformimino-5-aminoimidazole carboxamide ribotide isomerase